MDSQETRTVAAEKHLTENNIQLNNKQTDGQLNKENLLK